MGQGGAGDRHQRVDVARPPRFRGTALRHRFGPVPELVARDLECLQKQHAVLRGEPGAHDEGAVVVPVVAELFALVQLGGLVPSRQLSYQ